MKKPVLFILLITCLSCHEEHSSTIPITRVGFNLDLMYQDKELNGFNYKIFTQIRGGTDVGVGYGGLLVVNLFDIGDDHLVAYDLACPVEAQPNVRLTVDGAYNVVCTKCGASYSIWSGSPKSGSKYPLKTYRVVRTATGTKTFFVTH